MKKKTLFCGILIGLMIFSSCSSDDDSNSNSPSIVGSWKQINEIDFCSTGSQDVLILNSCEQTGRWILSDNGTYTRTFYELVDNDCILDFTDNGTWEINNGNLTITSNFEGSFEFTTFELTQNTLKIGADENSADPDPCNDGFLTSFTFDFERVD
ncbi:MAG: lipocalin family protein [Algicola sp.]|nr:lipocalin family protein [Algicola sp.]